MSYAVATFDVNRLSGFKVIKLIQPGMAIF